MYKFIKKYQNEISKCVKCGACQESCPTYSVSSDESMTARGRLALIKALINNKINLTRNFEKKISTCTTCMACEEICPNDVKVVEMINAVKFECSNSLDNKIINFLLEILFKKGMSLEYLSNFIHSGLILLPFLNNKKINIPPFSKKRLKSNFPEIIRPNSKPVLKVIFFLGCMMDLVYHSTALSILNILMKSNIEVIIPKNLNCCGAPLFYSGNRDAANYVAEYNTNIINSYNVDMIINSCATCGTMLGKKYNILNKNNKINVPIVDIHNFFIENINIFRYYQDRREKKIKVTYHDPCHLVRGQGIYNSPRKILNSIPWIEFIEMEDANKCCGGAGIFSLKHNKLSKQIVEKKIENIRKTGADIVATGCPSCQLHISEELKNAGIAIKVLHTFEVFNLRNG